MFVAYILSKIRAYRRYRQTIRELMRFTDRELEGSWHLPLRDRCHRAPERGFVNHFLKPSSSRRKENSQ